MGQDQSQSDSCDTYDLSKIEGFQVARLLPQSPAHQAGLVSYFDIIVALDHQNLKQGDTSPLSFFKKYISDHAGHPICLTVFNLRLRSYREVYFISNSEWVGGGLLGCSIQWTHADEALKQSWHITDILENSPAAFCPDLHANSVYIIGMQDTNEQIISLFKNEDDLYEWFSLWQDFRREEEARGNSSSNEPSRNRHSILFLIYDIEENSVKEVVVDMGTDYEAPIGFTLSSGLLHLIPAMEDGDVGNLPTMNQFFLPQDLAFETDYPPGADLKKVSLTPTATMQVESEVESRPLSQHTAHTAPPRDTSSGNPESDEVQKGFLELGGSPKQGGSIGSIPPPPLQPLSAPGNSSVPLPPSPTQLQVSSRDFSEFKDQHQPTRLAAPTCGGSTSLPQSTLETPQAPISQAQRDQERFGYVVAPDVRPVVGGNFEPGPNPFDLPGIPSPLEFPLFSNPLPAPFSSNK
ncbi:unnamed protein product [Phytomonas sp. EM1]|nr:unnamed protein product [Phytomonas sp. EM1]|eukprot:CCW60898.1 unnamed protein product [Phytomonas sp. isolate EM1]